MALRLEGDCSRCGDCCRDDESPTGYCEWAQINEDGTVACSDRTPSNPYYWDNCRVWPQTPQTLSAQPRCTFYFVVVED